MRILHYCDWFKEYTASLIFASSETSHEIDLVIRRDTREFTGRRQDEADINSRLIEKCHRVITLPGGYFSMSSAAFRELFRRKSYSRYDVLHLQINYDPRLLWLAWRMPTVLTVHEPGPRIGLPKERGAKGLTREWLRHLYRRFADVIIVHTDSGLHGLAPHEMRKAVVIPHGVDAVRRADDCPSSPVILFFGRVTGYKGIDTLLSAMEKVWTTRPDARLRILANPGDGLGGLDSACLDPRVHATWSGYSRRELELALAQARAVCLPYLSASGSGVGAQALASGKPIVATNVDGLRDLVAHEDLLVTPGCADDLARALLAVLDNDYRPRRVDPRRTWAAVAAAHLSVYESLTARNGGVVRKHGGSRAEGHRRSNLSGHRS